MQRFLNDNCITVKYSVRIDDVPEEILIIPGVGIILLLVGKFNTILYEY